MAEWSIEKVLEGKNYNCAVRLHKIIYEALSRMLLDNLKPLYQRMLWMSFNGKTQ